MKLLLFEFSFSPLLGEVECKDSFFKKIHGPLTEICSQCSSFVSVWAVYAGHMAGFSC